MNYPKITGWLIIFPEPSSVFNGYATSGKTGYTEEANKCLVFEGEGNDKNMIGIILNADETVIFTEASNTINAVVKEYELLEWSDPEDKERVVSGCQLSCL